MYTTRVPDVCCNALKNVMLCSQTPACPGRSTAFKHIPTASSPLAIVHVRCPLITAMQLQHQALRHAYVYTAYLATHTCYRERGAVIDRRGYSVNSPPSCSYASVPQHACVQ